MYITILGRQPAISIAELECLYGAAHVRWFSAESAIVESPNFDFERLGGSQKAGRIVAELHGPWHEISKKIVSEYTQAWRDVGGKLTLGISAYGFEVSSRDVQKTGIVLKSALKKHGVNIRLVPNSEPALNTAASHHNKLGLSHNKIELLVVRASSGRTIIAESVGSQNITALAARDQARPRTDAFVGMLPPKLARIMVNLASPTPPASILDPFCGTGVVLQEAMLLGFDAHGTDLSEKMVSYSRENLTWLVEKYRLPHVSTIEQADAMNASWHPKPTTVVCETYLGQPFSAPPSTPKLNEVRGNCNYIISTFLTNLGAQLKSGSCVILAVPAWRNSTGQFTHLPLIESLEALGYIRSPLRHVRNEQLIYYRETQVVARELLILNKK